MGSASEPIEVQKKELRLFWKKNYPKDPNKREVASKEIRHLLINQEAFQKAQRIALFAGLSWEIDLLPLLNLPNKVFLFPKTDSQKKELAFKRVQSENDLVSGALGILEPKNNIPDIDPRILDLVLVPGFAFDRFGTRIGTGAGYYDRFFSAFPKLNRWGICFHQQFHELELAHAHYDARMGAIVTECGFYSAKKVE
jgi:5-formyltetrahydrofolate cyclo-ligase